MGQCCSCVADNTTALPAQTQAQSIKQEVSSFRLLTPGSLGISFCKAVVNVFLVSLDTVHNHTSATTKGWIQDVGATRLTAVAASADTPVAPRSPSVVSLTPSSTEKRHRSVAASPTRFFELLVSKVVLSCIVLAQHCGASECCHAVYTWLQALCRKACSFTSACHVFAGG